MRFVITASLTMLGILTFSANHIFGLPQGVVSGFVRNAPMPIDVKIHSANAIFQSAMWYLNVTDGHFHVKGSVENTVPRASSVLVILNFYDNATGTHLATGGTWGYYGPSGIGTVGGVPAGVPIPFDIDTGYNASSTNEFKRISGSMY